MNRPLIPESEDFLYWDPERVAWYPELPEDAGSHNGTGAESEGDVK